MLWIILASQIVISPAETCVKADCHYQPHYWQTLTPDAQGAFMVRDEKTGRWRWHSLDDLGERD